MLIIAEMPKAMDDTTHMLAYAMMQQPLAPIWLNIISNETS